MGAEAHAAACLPAVAHRQDQQLPLDVQLLAIRHQLIVALTAAGLPIGGGGLTVSSLPGAVLLSLLGRWSTLWVTDLQYTRPSENEVTGYRGLSWEAWWESAKGFPQMP